MQRSGSVPWRRGTGPGGWLAALTLAALSGLAIALLPLELAASLVLGAIAVSLALLDPVWALYLAVLSVPVQELWLLPGGLSVTQAALLLAVTSLALHTLAFPTQPLRLGRLFVPLAIFVWTLALSAAFSPYSRAEGLRETARWATVPLVYLLALRALRQTDDGAPERGEYGVERRHVLHAPPRPAAQAAGYRLRSRPAPAPADSAGSLRNGSLEAAGGPSGGTGKHMPHTPQGAGGLLARGPGWRVWGLVACLLLAPALTAIVGLVQYGLSLGPESFGVGGGRVRAYGTIGQPNSFAGYMNQGWPLAAGLAVFAAIGLLAGAPRRPALWTLAGAGGAAALMLAALLASFSRGGWVGGAAGALALIIATIVLLPADLRPLARRLLVGGAAVTILVLGLGGGGLLPDTVTRRASSLVNNLRLFDPRGVDITRANFAVVERMAHLQAGWNMFASRPLLGVGPGNFSLAYERPPRAGEPPFSVRPWYESRGHAHNYYLHVAAEAGLLGLLAYLALIGAVVAQAVRALRSARSWFWRGVAAGGTAVVAAVAAHNLFENLHVLNMGLQLGAIWVLLTLVEETQP